MSVEGSSVAAAEVRELHRVPGEWRCLTCDATLSTDPDVTERPACPAGCALPLVPQTWKRWGPQQQYLLALERERTDAAIERGLALADAADELRGLVEAGQAREKVYVSERDTAQKLFTEEQGITTALRAQVGACWNALRWGVAAAALLGACAGAWISSLAR